MSRRSQITMTADEVDAFLAEPHLCRIGTMGPGGTVHLVAMNYGFLEGAPAFWTYRRAQKTLNLERDPTISMIVDAGTTYSELRGVTLMGKAVLHSAPEQLEAFARSIGQRYGGALTGNVGSAARASASKRIVVAIDVERVLSWDHRKLGGTY